MKRDERVLSIVKNKINSEYKNDISMLVIYGNKNVLKEENQGISLYFIPKTERGKNLSAQFVIEGVSYDVFPISWDRLIANAAMDSPQGYLLLDTEVAYCGDEEALKRFEGLKSSLETVLSGRYNEALLNKAYEYFNESYIYLFNMKKYMSSLSSVRLEAGKLLKKIANALAFANTDYYRNGNGTVIEDSFKLERLPKEYKNLTDEIIFADSGEVIYERAFTLVENTRDMLIGIKKEYAQPESFEVLFTGYYEELKKSINKYKNALEKSDYHRLFEISVYMQEEVAQFIAKVEEGIWYDDRNAYVEFSKHFEEVFKVDLLGLISSKDKEKILQGIEDFDEKMVSLMKKNNVELALYDSVDEFEIYFKEK